MVVLYPTLMPIVSYVEPLLRDNVECPLPVLAMLLNGLRDWAIGTKIYWNGFRTTEAVKELQFNIRKETNGPFGDIWVTGPASHARFVTNCNGAQKNVNSTMPNNECFVYDPRVTGVEVVKDIRLLAAAAMKRINITVKHGLMQQLPPNEKHSTTIVCFVLKIAALHSRPFHKMTIDFNKPMAMSSIRRKLHECLYGFARYSDVLKLDCISFTAPSSDIKLAYIGGKNEKERKKKQDEFQKWSQIENQMCFSNCVLPEIYNGRDKLVQCGFCEELFHRTCIFGKSAMELSAENDNEPLSYPFYCPICISYKLANRRESSRCTDYNLALTIGHLAKNSLASTHKPNLPDVIHYLQMTTGDAEKWPLQPNAIPDNFGKKLFEEREMDGHSSKWYFFDSNDTKFLFNKDGTMQLEMLSKPFNELVVNSSRAIEKKQELIFLVCVGNQFMVTFYHVRTGKIETHNPLLNTDDSGLSTAAAVSCTLRTVLTFASRITKEGPYYETSTETEKRLVPCVASNPPQCLTKRATLGICGAILYHFAIGIHNLYMSEHMGLIWNHWIFRFGLLGYIYPINTGLKGMHFDTSYIEDSQINAVSTSCLPIDKAKAIKVLVVPQIVVDI